MVNDIFAWVGYGCVDVYSIKTYEDSTKLLDLIVSCLDNWDLDDRISEIKELSDEKKNVETTAYCINMLLQDIDVGSHESFEYGTGFAKLK